jgi:hypothetical protein
MTLEALEAYRKRAFYETILKLSEACVRACEREKMTELAAEMRKITDAIKGAKGIRERRKKGEISLEEQREEVLKRWHEVFNKRFLRVLAEDMKRSQTRGGVKRQ